MVETQLSDRDIHDRRVLAVMGEIPRELFVADALRHRCYYDEPVSIGYGQTLSQPYMTALMAQCLELTGTENVLEVGAGCGYHAAVLGCLAARIVTIEIVPELAALARENLDRAGLGGNIEVIEGDGSLGWPPAAPYDAISVACAAPEVPAALRDQLTADGRLVIPVGSRYDQDLLLVRRSARSFTCRTVTYCRFVPLVGSQGWHG
jgi:protein-L-isoaspartate(D-aspartate) O-methyltransferase